MPVTKSNIFGLGKGLKTHESPNPVSSYSHINRHFTARSYFRWTEKELTKLLGNLEVKPFSAVNFHSVTGKLFETEAIHDCECIFKWF